MPQLRGLAWMALSETGQVGAGSIVDDSGGGGVTIWTYGGAVPCRLDPLSAGSGRLTGGQIDERSTHAVTVPPGTTVSTTSRVLIAGRGTFEVTAIRLRTDEQTTVCEVIPIL